MFKATHRSSSGAKKL